MMPSWASPIEAAGASDPKPFAAAAKLKAFADSQQLYRTTLRTAGPRLRDATELAAQVAAFAGQEAGAEIVRAFDGPFQRIRRMDDLAESPVAVAAVAAYGGVARALGVRIERVGPPDAGSGPYDPAFGVDLSTLPPEIMDAIERLDVTVLEGFIDAFPDSGRTYVDLLGLAAEMCTRAVQQGFIIEPAATWLSRAIRDRVVAPVPGPAMLAQAAHAARRTTLFASGSARDGTARAWRSIELDARHGLWPGMVVTVFANGEVVAVKTAGYSWRDEPRRGRLADSALAEIDRLIATHDLRRVVLSVRAGVPDEGSMKLTLVAERTILVNTWTSDAPPDVTPFLRWLYDAGEALCA